jgi:hypothetical protein
MTQQMEKQTPSDLPEVFADFARLGARPEDGMGLSVPMGTDDLQPDLRGLREGQRVALVEWGNLWAEGTVHIVESGGHRYYYGVIARREDIRDIG